MKRFIGALLLSCVVLCWPAAAQTWDSSGNGLLNGTYYFRQVMWLGGYNTANELHQAIAIYGSIAFGGNGTYTLTAQAVDAAAGTTKPVTGSGTYTLAASGYGYMSTPLQFVYSQFAGDEINLLVSPSQVVAGNTSDNSSGYNDLFLAAPAPATTPTLQGTFSVIGAGVPALTLDLLHTRSYSFTMTGTSSTITTTALTGSLGLKTAAKKQAAFSAVKYSVNSGAAAVTFGSELTTADLDTNLMSGTKNFYFSPDGSFFFGGDSADTDFIVGVRQGSPKGSFAAQTLYYTAGFFQDNSQVANCNCAWLNSLYGGYSVVSGGSNPEILVHQRDNAVGPPRGSFVADSAYSELPILANGTYSDFFYNYYFGAGGTFAIGFANQNSGFLGIEVLMQGPHYKAAPASAPYIYPTGIVNAGAYVPFTAQFAPGETISLFGANLSPITATDTTFPTNLGGVEVLVNGVPTSLSFVSPGQINAVIPLDINTGTALIQVVNSQGTSNTVSNFVGETQPGIFNSAASTPAIFHANNSMVTASNPAVPGEVLAIYLTGLGTLNTSGKATWLNYMSVAFSGVDAAIDYAGIEPGVPVALGAGYQLNVTVPSGAGAGLNYLEISGLGSYNSEAFVCVSSCTQTSVQSNARSRQSMTVRPAVRPRFPDSPTVVFPQRAETR